MSGMGLLLGCDAAPPSGGGGGPPLTGLALWLKADAEAYADGAAVTTWHDQSGNGNDGTVAAGFEPVFKTGIVNGLPIVRFATTDTRTMTLPNFMSGFSAGSVFMMLKNAASAATSMTHWGTNGDGDFYPFGDGNLYLGDGSTARKSCGAPVATLTNFHLLEILSASGSWACYLNQLSQFSTGSNTVGFTAAPEFGRNIWGGDIAEVLVYSSALGSTDRAAVETYLDAKYALGF